MSPSDLPWWAWLAFPAAVFVLALFGVVFAEVFNRTEAADRRDEEHEDDPQTPARMTGA